MVKIAGPHGGITPEALRQLEHTVSTGGDIQQGDPPDVVRQKLADYNDAVSRLSAFNGQDGTDYATQVPTGGYSGHYEFSPEALQDTINEWQDIVDGLEEDRRYIEKIVRTKAPSPDIWASQPQAESARNFGHRMHKRNQSMHDYAQKYLDSLKRTKAEYEKQERHTSNDMTRQMGQA